MTPRIPAFTPRAALLILAAGIGLVLIAVGLLRSSSQTLMPPASRSDPALILSVTSTTASSVSLNPSDTPPATAVPPTPTASAPADLGSMVEVPAGSFQFGCDPDHNGVNPCNFDNEWEPRLQTLVLDAFQIDRYEVTNGEYATCVAAGFCAPLADTSSPTRPSYFGNPEFSNYPVMNVTWEQAAAYCAWQGKRLPTEAEWEKAARGGADTRPYPWGETAPTCALANFSSCAGDTDIVGYYPKGALTIGSRPIYGDDTVMVGSYPEGASPYGALDMAGNVSEWVADWYHTGHYLFITGVNPLGPLTGPWHVFRGGDWNSIAIELTHRVDPKMVVIGGIDQPMPFTGIRCAALAGGEAPLIPGAQNPLLSQLPPYPLKPPAPGTANAYGRVYWNGQPVVETEVKIICQDDSSSDSSCAVKEFTATTDAQGIYAFEDIPPGIYTVQAHAIDEDRWFIQVPTNQENQDPMYYPPGSEKSVEHQLNAGETADLSLMQIYKFDLQLADPPDGAVLKEAPALQWETYPGAAYYGASFDYTPAEKVIGNTVKVSFPLQNCEYTWKVEAYDAYGVKLSEAYLSDSFYLISQPSSCELPVSSPGDEAAFAPGEDIVFSWSEDGWADEYRLVLFGSYFEHGLTEIIVSGTTYTLEEDLPADSYSFYVEAFMSGGEISRSQSYQFAIIESSQLALTPAPTPSPVPPASMLEMPMVLIPAGPFQMGGMWCSIISGGTCLEKKPDEKNPPHTVTLAAFSIDQYEVTNAQYAECVAAGQCQAPEMGLMGVGEYYGLAEYNNHPVSPVSWFDAEAYCSWKGKRLPTEAEWEKAARGGLELQFYPWGDQPPTCTPGAVNSVQYGGCSPNDPRPVGSFAPNGYGLYDMAGNVAEWVADWFQEDYYTLQPFTNPRGPESGTTKVIRGGGTIGGYTDYLHVDYRDGYWKPGDSLSGFGFRCAADAH